MFFSTLGWHLHLSRICVDSFWPSQTSNTKPHHDTLTHQFGMLLVSYLETQPVWKHSCCNMIQLCGSFSSWTTMSEIKHLHWNSCCPPYMRSCACLTLDCPHSCFCEISSFSVPASFYIGGSILLYGQMIASLPKNSPQSEGFAWKLVQCRPTSCFARSVRF